MNLKQCLIGAMVAVPVLSGVALATPVTLTWESTVTSVSATLPAGVTLGDPFTFSLTVDNGGTSLLSQSWSVTDLVSATIDVEGGAYTATMFGGAGGFNSFETDGSGNVSAVGSWSAVPVTTFSDTLGNNESNATAAWFINGFNEVFGVLDPQFNLLFAISSPDVEGNQLATNWTATLDTTPSVPEPASLTLLGLAGIGARRWRQRKP